MAAKYHSATDQQTLVVREHRHCDDEELRDIRACVGPLLVRFSAYDREEKARMRQKIAYSAKAALDANLKGNWNVLVGSDMQVSVGLLPDCRLVRLECRQERLFCFETHTHLFDPTKPDDQSFTDPAGANKQAIPNDKQPAGQPQAKPSQLDAIPENPELAQNAQNKASSIPASQQQQSQPKGSTQLAQPSESDKTSDLASNAKQNTKTASDQPAGNASATKTANDKQPADKTGDSDISRPKDSNKPAPQAPAPSKTNK